MKTSLIFENMAVDDDYYWAFARTPSSSIHGIAQANRKNGNIRFELLPVELKRGDDFADLLKVGQKLYLIPKGADRMLIYDIFAGMWEDVLIRIPEKGGIYKPNQKFSTAVAYQEYLYLFPCFYPAIVKYHLLTGETEYLYGCMDVLNGYPAEETKGMCDQLTTAESRVVFFSKRYGMLLQFEMESRKLTILENFGIQELFCVFAADSQSYWLVPYKENRPIIRWDKKEKTKEMLPKEIPGFISGRAPFSWSAVLGGFVWLIPGLANMALKIDIDGGTVTEAEQFRPVKAEAGLAEECWKFCFAKKIKDEIFAFDVVGRELAHYDNSSGICTRERYSLLAEDVTRLEYQKLYEMITIEKEPNRKHRRDERFCATGKKIYRHCAL